MLGILVKNNRLDWFLEEMDYFVKNSLVQSDESLFKNFSFRNKNAKQILQIKKLISCRDCWAKKVNVPRRHLLKDEVIEVVVRNSSGYDFSILKLDNLMVEEMRKILDEDVIVDDVETSLTMSPSDKDMCEVAKSFVRDYAKQIDLSEQFLMTSYDLRKSICNRDFFSEKVFGWRYELFGKELEKIIFNPDPSLELPRSCTKPKPC